MCSRQLYWRPKAIISAVQSYHIGGPKLSYRHPGAIVSAAHIYAFAASVDGFERKGRGVNGLRDQSVNTWPPQSPHKK